VDTGRTTIHATEEGCFPVNEPISPSSDQATMTTHRSEVTAGERFEFGENWARFLKHINASRIELAMQSLRNMLATDSLAGKRFVDIGCGSGLFSLAARQLGATVVSLDFDPQSLACTQELRRKYFPDDPDWKVVEGSVLDAKQINALGRFDVVYSWGVLHHTGSMWKALANVVPLVATGGALFIAIYNDQGPQSQRWHTLKRLYNKLPRFLRPAYLVATMGPRELRYLIGATLRGRPMSYFSYRYHYAEHSLRGMNYYRDLVDWIGGYPFEVAKPEEIVHFYGSQGLSLTALTTCGGGLGCNEFVFRRN
jgi:2-polyprenyl-3-methyl-5-hydroxy-6-metoxy-1,4-benzoquinol methylase